MEYNSTNPSSMEFRNLLKRVLNKEEIAIDELHDYVDGIVKENIELKNSMVKIHGITHNWDKSNQFDKQTYLTLDWDELHESYVTDMKISPLKSIYEHLQDSFYWFKKTLNK